MYCIFSFFVSSYINQPFFVNLLIVWAIYFNLLILCCGFVCRYPLPLAVGQIKVIFDVNHLSWL